MEWIFVGITGVVALLAVGNWRAAMYCCLLLDVARDPVRKLSEGQSSLSTVIVGVVWFAALLGAISTNDRELRLLSQRYPYLPLCFIMLVLALMPGALISLVSYDNGWMLSTIGIVSYTAPFIGVVLGYLWPRQVNDVYRWVSVYVIVNAIFLIGVLLEYASIDAPGLGGMNMIWLRNYGTDLVALMCGFYRSPDVMGLHAAHVIMFAMLLALRPGKPVWWAWLALSVFAMVCLLLCGRRKMIAIPVVFLVVYVALVFVSIGRKRFAISLAALAVAIVVGMKFMIDSQEIPSEYSRYAATIATEGFTRTSTSFTATVFHTVDQSGWLGSGLGTVTQGRQYLDVVTGTKDWQEDGVGRLFKELGVPGVVLAMISGICLLRTTRHAFAAIPSRHPVLPLQIGMLSIVAANLASFVVSHQAYSGDPATVLMVGFCLGIGLGLPRTVSANVRMPSQQPIAKRELVGID